MRVQGEDKRRTADEGGRYLSIMHHPLTQEELADCEDYSRRLARYYRDGGTHPGMEPPRYGVCRRMTDPPTYNTYPPVYIPSYPMSGNPENTVSMPSDAFTTLFDSQRQIVELMINGRECGFGARCFPNPWFPPPPLPKPRRAHNNKKKKRNGGKPNRGRRASGRHGKFGHAEDEDHETIPDEIVMQEVAAMRMFPILFPKVSGTMASSSLFDISSPPPMIEHVPISESSEDQVTARAQRRGWEFLVSLC